MKYKIFLSIYFLMLSFSPFAQSITQENTNPRYRIFLNTNDGKIIEGLLIQLEDSTLIVFQGSRKEWNNNTTGNTIKINYSQIQQIRLKRKNGLLRGMLIGTGAGILPVLIGSLLGPSIGEGSAYVSIAATPLGFVTGGIVGGTSKKKYNIDGDISKFYHFKKRIKKP